MKKIQLKKYLLKSTASFVAIACLVVLGAGVTAGAQTSGGFSIHAVIPDNQLDTRQTYFDLRMNPGAEQTIQLVITNSRPEELVAQVRLNDASTGRDGIIVYTDQDIRDESLKVAATDVATLEEREVTVPAHSSQPVNIHIKMPVEPFDGVILGGITVSADEAETDNETAQGISLKNTITYVIALKLSENDNEAAPDFDLTSVTPSLINHRTSVVVTVRNRAARIVKGMGVKAQVYRKDSDAVLHEITINEAEMAPLSEGDFVIDWEGESLKPGEYQLKMTAAYEGQTWDWDEEFIIADVSVELNKEAVGLEKDYRWLYFLLGFAVAALVWIISYRMRKRGKKDED